MHAFFRCDQFTNRNEILTGLSVYVRRTASENIGRKLILDAGSADDVLNLRKTLRSLQITRETLHLQRQ